MPSGPTRVPASEKDRPFGSIRLRLPDIPTLTIGTLAGYPDIPRLIGSFTDEAGKASGVHSVFPCYVLDRQGWPMGDNNPACSRIGPPAVREISQQEDPDGTPRVTWKPPPSDLNPEPVTGYEIEVFADEEGRNSPIKTFGVPSDTTSVALPPLELYAPHRVSIRADSAVGLGDIAESFDIRYYRPVAPIRV